MAERRSTPWLLRDPSPSSRALLFAIPYLGAGASMFAAWPRRINNSIEVCPIQLPGREDRLAEPALERHAEVCVALVEALAPIVDRPYAFFGHCAGAYVAFEAAWRTAARLARPPAAVFVSAMTPPNAADDAPILGLDAAEVQAFVRDLVVRRHGTADPELVALAEEAFAADLSTYRSYRHTGTTPTPTAIVAIGWDRDPEIPAAALAGWADYARGFEHLVLSGDHWSFLDAPAILQDVIAAALEDV